MDAMSDAIEGADVMMYGVSLRYKESANVSEATFIACNPNGAAADSALTLAWALPCLQQ